MNKTYKSTLKVACGRRMALGFVAIFFAGASLSLTMAQEADAGKEPISIVMKAEVAQKNDDGSESRTAAAQVEPGNIIVYTVTCSNTSSRVISEIKPVIPVPAEMELIIDSLSPETAEGSAGEGKFAAVPLQHEVKKEDGSVVSEPLPESAYRAIRWTIPTLAPGQSVDVSLRARVKVTTVVPAANSDKK